MHAVRYQWLRTVSQIGQNRSFDVTAQIVDNTVGSLTSCGYNMYGSEYENRKERRTPMPNYLGSCHCGAVKFAVDADIKELTTCDCSLCSKKNALMAKVNENQLCISNGEEYLTLYQWNTGRAKHYFCSRCGIYTFHRKRVSPDHFGVNVRCLDGFDPKAIPTRVTPGACMSITCSDPRSEWPGPRGEN